MPGYPLPTWRNQAGDGGADSRENRARDLLREHFGARVDDLPDILPEMHAEISFTMLGAADAVIASLLSDPTDQVVRAQAQPALEPQDCDGEQLALKCHQRRPSAFPVD
jgi:hypothetical protein